MSSTLRGGALEWNSSITSRRFNFDDSSYSAFSASRTYAPVSFAHGTMEENRGGEKAGGGEGRGRKRNREKAGERESGTGRVIRPFN